MAVPYGKRFPIEFDELFPEGAYVVGAVTAVTDIDEATRALASARGVDRCQVRELTPNVVSIDFQHHNLLAEPVSCPDLATLAGINGEAIDLRRVWAGRTEYGQDDLSARHDGRGSGDRRPTQRLGRRAPR
jgi:hypothetical protein